MELEFSSLYSNRLDYIYFLCWKSFLNIKKNWQLCIEGGLEHGVFLTFKYAEIHLYVDMPGLVCSFLIGFVLIYVKIDENIYHLRESVFY